MQTLDTFLFGIYPYIAVTIFLLGSWLRYDHGAYTWRAGSSQMLSPGGMWFASNVFHIGIIGLICAHLYGKLLGSGINGGVLTVSAVFGILILIGGGILLFRRLTNVRVRSTSNRSDLLVITLLVLLAVIGLLIKGLGDFTPTVMELYPDSFLSYMESIVWSTRIHRALGWTMLVIFPFTRLVHIWSIPLEYLTRRYQIVRVRR
ncbi:MAG: respiratory nitrate reductase subunit gamma [Proteobacteria bacterium]|nr:respiratory nitrate reductase subunit gamma [Pseudomonadota bacterium]